MFILHYSMAQSNVNTMEIQMKLEMTPAEPLPLPVVQGAIEVDEDVVNSTFGLLSPLVMLPHY